METTEKEWFSKLTEEQKEKLSKLEGGTVALIAFCKEEKLDLPNDLLEAVSGGVGKPRVGLCSDGIP